ncbi:ATP-binding protein [Gorillibacterium sp. sgz5001074]|uniref:ATP-binding protein n=1 Tax=Gorillibacterium sp. sgz5001074 TaxID=3446695 RepID=UPI003F681CC5
MKRKFFTIFALSMLLILQTWFLYLTFAYPINWIYVAEDHNEWKVSRIDGRHSVAYPLLKVGDTIVAINEKPPGEFPSVLRWKSLEQTRSVTVMREGSMQHYEASKNPTPAVIDLVAFAAESVSFIIAYLLLKKARNSASSSYLSAVFVDIGVAFMSLTASVRGDMLGKLLISTALVMLPIFFYHFISIFLKQKGQIHLPLRFLPWAYFTAGVFFLSYLIFLLPPSTAYTMYSNMIMVTVSITIIGMLTNISILIATSYRYRNRKDFLSLILRTVTFSMIFSLAPILLLSFVPQLLFGREWVDSVYTSLFIFILPLTFAYLIVAKKLYDIDMVMRRILFTGLISLVPSLVFTAMIRLLFSESSSNERLGIVFLIFLASITFILYSLENLSAKLEPVMFPRKYRLTIALKNISRNLRTISSLREMKDIILLDIIDTLEMNGGAIVFKYSDHTEAICEGDISPSEAGRLVKEWNPASSTHTLYEITRHEEFTSYLILSERHNRSVLNSEEIHWLMLIITYLAVSLENIHLIRKLTVKLEQFASHMPEEHEAGEIAWFRKLMFELQEKERSRIATDLHDTTMQDLFFLKERLRNLLTKYSFRKEDLEAMDGLMDYIDIINTNLRQSCFELHPYLLKEIGLVQTVRKLIDLESISVPFEIEFTVSGASHLEQEHPDTKRHLFRLIQELLNNAKKHSKADRLHLSLRAGYSGIVLDYEDDGIGYDPQSMNTGEIGGPGIGLEQMKSRIISMGGSYRIDSAPGRGMKLEASIPIRKEQLA